jgi:glycosyltransferase involved in cell wall biosynthesis
VGEPLYRDTVTCVVPVRDGEPFLGAALDSILAQSRPPQEVIVVDDGSTDGSAELARAYGPPVRVIESGRTGAGVAAARKRGVDAARGGLVCFLDADDLYDPLKQERQLERFAARPELEVSLCTYEMFWEPGLGDEEARYRAVDRVRGSHMFQTMLVRRSAFGSVGPIDASRAHGDQVEWLARAADAGAVIEVIDDVLVHRRMHRDSASHVSPSLESYVDIVKDRLDRVRGRV